MAKKSSIIHHDSFAVVHTLPDEVAGRFAKALAILMTGEEPNSEDLWALSLLHPFRNQFQRDLEKYQAACNKNRENGKKGGRPANNPVGSIETQNNPVGFLETQNNPKKPDSDSDSDSEKKRKKDNASFDARIFLSEREVPEQIISDWLKCRKEKRLANTLTAFELVISQAQKAKITLAEAIKESCERGWGGFRADWIKDKTETTKQKTADDVRRECGIIP